MRRGGVAVALVAVLTACAAIGAGVLGGQSPTSTTRSTDGRVLVPQDLSWRVHSACASAAAGQTDIDACLSRFQFSDGAGGFNYVDGYERAQLWDYYNLVTVPCLVAHDVRSAPLDRADFFVPGERPWNPYTDMTELPVDDLLALYEACPPVPDYLIARHRT